MQKDILYQRAKTGKIKVWSTWIVDKGDSGYPEIHYEWGLTDGKKQLTIDIMSSGVNEGKANETTPLEQALLTLQRKVKKKKEEGYNEDISKIEIEDIIDFTKPLSKSLCFYKPKNSLPDNKLNSLSKPIYTIKRDGMMHVIRKSNKFGVEIYSRRMDLVTEKYPHIVEALEAVPHEFILLGEIILDENGIDNFNGVSQICRSDPPKAIARQEELGWVKYYVFDIAFFGKYNLLVDRAYIDRLNVFEESIKCSLSNNSVILCEILNYNDDIVEGRMRERCNNKTHNEALEEVKERGLEGLVVWDAEGIMEQKYAFTFNGKASRPNVLWKSKPKYEDDYIADFDPVNDIGEFGKGKNNGKIKSAFLYQLDENNNRVFLGKCGGGLSDEQRDFYTTAEWPRVWRIEYDSIQIKTGSPRFPVFNADRTLMGDKLISECIMSEAIKDARKEYEQDE